MPVKFTSWRLANAQPARIARGSAESFDQDRAGHAGQMDVQRVARAGWRIRQAAVDVEGRRGAGRDVEGVAQVAPGGGDRS